MCWCLLVLIIGVEVENTFSQIPLNDDGVKNN